MLTAEEKQAMIEKTLFGDSLSADAMERELRLFKEFRDHLISSLGEQVGGKVFHDFIFNRTSNAWKETVKLCVEDTSLENFVNFFWGPLKKSLKYDEIWDGDEKVTFKVTHCTVYEACKKAGLTDIGYHVYCMTDPAVVDGINPDINFQRTHTLMQGDGYCDNCYICKCKK